MAVQSEIVLNHLRQAYARLELAKASLGASGEPGRQLAAAQQLAAGVAESVKRAAAGDPDLTQCVLDAFPGSRVIASTPRDAA